MEITKIDSMSFDQLKLNIREDVLPYFDDVQLAGILKRFGGDVRKASYYCLLLKSENTTLSISGLSLQDTSNYFLRLASKYRDYNTGVLK